MNLGATLFMSIYFRRKKPVVSCCEYMNEFFHRKSIERILIAMKLLQFC